MADAATEKVTRPIIILGMDRSGTSLIAQLVSRWGAYGGSVERLSRGDSFNPTGYWENGRMVKALHELFWQRGLQFWDAGFEEALRREAANPQSRERARALVAAMERESEVWFWKEPLLSVLLPFWQEFWGDATYVIAVRNPYESALSWQKFLLGEDLAGRVSLVAANLLRWQIILLSALRGTEGSPRRLFVGYEELVRDPAGQCGRLCRFLDTQTGRDEPQAGRVEHMAAAVDPALRRHASPLRLAEVPEASRAQIALYELLQRKLVDPGAVFDPADYPVYPGWREYLANLGYFEAYYRQAQRTLGRRPVRFVAGGLRWADRLRAKGAGPVSKLRALLPSGRPTKDADPRSLRAV